MFLSMTFFSGTLLLLQRQELRKPQILVPKLLCCFLMQLNIHMRILSLFLELWRPFMYLQKLETKFQKRLSRFQSWASWEILPNLVPKQTLLKPLRLAESYLETSEGLILKEWQHQGNKFVVYVLSWPLEMTRTQCKVEIDFFCLSSLPSELYILFSKRC